MSYQQSKTRNLQILITGPGGSNVQVENETDPIMLYFSVKYKGKKGVHMGEERFCGLG